MEAGAVERSTRKKIIANVKQQVVMEIFQDQAILDEVSEQNIDALYKLVEDSEERDRDVSLLIEDMQERAAEYEAAANYLQSALTESFGLSPSSLSKEGIAHLNTLVNCAMILETKDTSLTSLFCAITDMGWELHATESKNRKLEEELASVKKKVATALALEKQLKEDLKKAEERYEAERDKVEYQCQNLNFLKDKSEDFKIRIKAAEEQLAATGLDQSLMHHSLVSLSEKLAAIQEETAPLKKELEFYQDLPPSLFLAQVKIEETKRELNALEDEFSRQLEMLTLEMLESS